MIGTFHRAVKKKIERILFCGCQKWAFYLGKTINRLFYVFIPKNLQKVYHSLFLNFTIIYKNRKNWKTGFNIKSKTST